MPRTKAAEPATGAWMPCDRALPFPGAQVSVRGAYTPDAVAKPQACLAPDPLARGQMRWSSREWRGMVAIEAWWLSSP